MNKIYKVMYSKVKQCAVVVSEIAKSHGHNGESSGVRKHAALTAAVLLALGSLSFTTAFVPMTAEAADKTRTDGSNFVGVERTNGLIDESKYENSGGKGAQGADSITLGLHAQAGAGTITIGDRRSSASMGSVYVGHGDIANPELDTGGWVTSIGYNSDATGYGSIALGSNAVAKNFYAKDSKGNSLKLNDDTKFRLNPKPDIQRASVAIGYGASADNGNIAIGSYSDASTDLRTAKTTDGQEIKSYLTDKKADSYVSVGKSDALRRISNVADGASASDVATVGQLQALAAKSGTYKAGFGIEITPDTTAKENTINLKRNLGNNSTSVTEVSNTGLILGGDFSGTYRPDEKYGNYGATGQYAVTLGGRSNRASGESSVAAGGMDNTADGNQAFVGGGSQNTASGRLSSAIGGAKNTASGLQSSAFGGSQNTASGQLSSAIGGDQNTASGSESSAIGGAKNIASGWKSSAFGGTDNISLDMLSSTLGGMNSVVLGYYATGIAGGSTGSNAWNALAAGSNSVVTVENGTAIGYQATTNERGTIAFGHDSGDVSGYTVTWQQRTDKDSSGNIVKNADGTTNDYTKDPTITENTYSSAYYNRLVKAADGIEDHDAVVMEQLKNASGVGSKIKVYQTDENGNIKFDKNNNPIEDTSAEAETKKTAAQKASEDAWGSAIGTGKVVDPNAKDKDSNGSGQLVTGGTVYNALQQQKTDLTDALTVKPGWGIEKTKNNTISVKHNLSTGDSAYAAAAYADSEAKGLILGGSTRDRIAGKKYGATTKTSVIVGARDALASNDNTVVIGGEENIASGESTTVVGGLSNTASGQGYSAAASVFGGSFNIANGLCSVVLGGIENVANNDYSTNSGGVRNVVFGSESINSGGLKNVVYANNASSFGGVAAAVNGEYSTGIAGGSTARNAQLSFAAGFQSVVTDSGVRKTIITGDEYERKWSEQTRELGPVQAAFNPITNKYEQYDKISTALGYQATADEPGTIAFGHDAGDESGYTYEWETLTDENGKPKENDIDNTTNDYTKPPKSVNKKDPYTSSYYNRLVKVADGIDDHDVVVMEQLKNASDVGNNIKVYKTDENGNVQFDENNKPIEDRSDAAKTKQKDSKDAWGKALGAGTFTTGTDTTPTNASTSYQLVTGKTLYDYDKPTGSQNYVNVNSTTGQNLSALDTQVKANTDALTKPNHNIKYYAVDETTLPKLTNFNGKDYSNEKNNGAVGMGSIAAGFNTHADGIASTVAGSYSGVINQNSAGLYDLRGATALSYGTFNINQNTDTGKIFSGVANSIVGQANATTDSNAAIIYGAGNTVTNSYRKIDDTNASEIMKAALSKDVKKLDEALQKAVPTSGGQVMVMGGGNNVESAYMTQVVGVGNTVKGNQVYTKDAKTGKWNWTTDTNDETAIEDYDPKKSSQYNYVDGFSNEVINGKHDYVIGANNTVTGDSYDDKDAKKYSNESNIIFGDNHTVTNTKNAVIIGSSDTQMTLDQGDRATAIGHNASAQRDALAVGVNTEARGNAVALGTYSTAHNNSIAIGTKATAVSSQNLAIGWEAHIGNIKTDDEKIKNAIALGSDSQVKVNDLLESDNNRGVLSIGDKDKERRIIHVRAGVNDTDAVNVSQLKSVQSGLTDKGLTFVTNDGEHTAKLGSKVTIQGTAKKADHEYTADNLTTVIDDSGNITILMDKNISADKIAVNGKDGKDAVSIAGKDGVGHIGLTGPAGTNGMDGADGKPGNSIDITVKNGYNVKGKDGKDGINGENGVDGTSLTRIVYKDATGEHQIATLEDGLKFKGDDRKEISKKLNNTLEIIGGADSTKLTEKNIGVNKTDDGKLKIQLANELNGITSIGNQKTEDGKTSGGKITFGTDSSVNVNGGKITNVGDGTVSADSKDAINGETLYSEVRPTEGKYVSAGKTTAQNLTDLDKQIQSNEAQITNMDNRSVKYDMTADGKSVDKTKITLAGEGGTTIANVKDGSVSKDSKEAVNGGQLFTEQEARKAEDNAINKKIGTLDTTKTYNYIDATKSISENLDNLDTKVKKDITDINNSISTLDQNAVKYDDSTKGQITLGGQDGTKITNVKDGSVAEGSKEAVNGGQLWKVDQKVDNNTTEINKIKNGDFTDASKKAIHNIAKDAVEVVDGLNTKAVKKAEGTDTTPTQYAVNVEGNGKVASGDTGLISGGTLYNEVHVNTDGTYIKSKDSDGKDMTVAQNLSALDTGLKTTSDLIHMNDKGDIQIGGSSKATKIDVNGKDGGRVITGVVTDAQDASSAANVGYVNGVTAANTQQIYRDMNSAYGRLNSNINKAAAGSNALAALHPLDYDPDDKADFAVGYGHYRNANAAAVGAFYHPNENTMVNVGVSLGNGDPGFNAGVSFKVGRGGAGHEAMSKTEMAKVINSQSKEIDALKKDNADKDKRIDALEQKMAEILAKLDKSGK